MKEDYKGFINSKCIATYHHQSIHKTISIYTLISPENNAWCTCMQNARMNCGRIFFIRNIVGNEHMK